jgi:hypothetical protein
MKLTFLQIAFSLLIILTVMFGLREGVRREKASAKVRMVWEDMFPPRPMTEQEKAGYDSFAVFMQRLKRSRLSSFCLKNFCVGP